MLTLRKRNRRRLPHREWRTPAIDWRRISAALAFFGLAAALAYGLMGSRSISRSMSSPSRGKFQRVSPGQIEEAVTHGLHDGFMSVDLERSASG